ncbi:MAG: hypothetical protein M5U24_01455 [Candidatus Kuenenia sp.]|nr:hypothetical protein [Candidatus Kuenenia sp.]MCZ7621142.1 hypothetical protein [Candidatus Kuenenia sp.]
MRFRIALRSFALKQNNTILIIAGCAYRKAIYSKEEKDILYV